MQARRHGAGLQRRHRLDGHRLSSSSSSSWSGQVHRDQQSGGSNGNGTRRQPQGEATAGQAAASVRLPPPHSSLAGSAWGHGAPALGSGRLQVWWTPLDVATTCSPTATARNRGCITPAEAAEVGGSKSAEVAAKRTAARALARTVLARAVGGALEEEAGGSSSSGSAGTSAAHSAGTGSSNGCTTAVSPQDLRFARNSHGKPHLVAGGPGWPVLRHNLTHTHDLAGVAVLREPGRAAAATGAHASGGTSGPDGTGGGGGGGTGGGGRVFMSVGLDVERLDRAPRDPMALARRRLAAAEVRDLEAIKDAKQRARHFMWLWTLKEAYVKARGTGINAPPGLKGFAIGFKEMPADQQLAVEAMCGPSRGAAPRLAAITITHCAASPPPPAASAPNPPLSAARAAEAAHGAVSSSGVATTAAPAQPSLPPAPVRPQSQSLPDADVGTDAQFHFLLFQPTPAHVGALCIATQQQQQQQSPAATALSACGASSADSDCVSDASSSGSDCSSGGGSSGSGSSGTCWAALVEHWWCVPLEGEAQLLPHELTLLGCTADAAKAP
ncbi:hypothetical protein HXX76_001216 [Chlamydomonas incerta]|uniref:holo-[acyl-carrier-protein] synthase n=1 Tax=Chlamydomonas incerta TaxID=51695 RepID=A0A835WBP7_CHLIN|nr:hypothetical protein HXX76_001216 [Chlamydomonas incerta]|eukprot:KAG2444464.1 hypothetical protein HXX76_001216 [Chlamydomonas incerta]